MSLFEGLILESMHVHGECHLDGGLFLCGFFLIFMVSAHHVPIIVVGNIGKPHIISTGVHVETGFGVIDEALLEIFGMHLLISRVACYLVDLVSFGGVEGLDQFGGLYSSTLAALEVIYVFVLHVEIEGGVAEVLLGAEAFVSGQVFVVFGL